MWVRIQELSFAPDLADSVIQQIRDTAIARYDGESHRGFRLLMDRPNGKALDVSYWADATGAHSVANAESSDAVSALGATAGTTNYYELVIDAG
jgi:hypothetical protein